MASYVILEDPSDPVGEAIAYEPFGGSRQLWLCKDHEVMLSGPSETGKTLSALHKLDALAWKYAGMRGAIIRKTYQSALQSVIVTYEKKVLGAWDQETQRFRSELTPVEKYGGERPDWYDYPNGSRIIIGGMDKPGKVLSSEYDVIFVNQAEELELDDWEILGTRCTGRAGNMPYAQIIGDCNPSYPQHWILDRAKGSLAFLESRHEDNPALYDPTTGLLTAQGETTMAILDSLTGVRRERLRFGRWAQAEGIVYEEYDPAIHLIDRFDIPGDWRHIRSTDYGYTNPFVTQWWAVDHDGRMYLYREIYQTRRTVKEHAEKIMVLSEGESSEAHVSDHDASDRATMLENGIATLPANKAVSPGIQAVKERLKVAGDGKSRLFILRDSIVDVDPVLQTEKRPMSTADEIPVYMWNNRATKDEPVKENDHGMDAMRYAVMYVDSPKRPHILMQSVTKGW